MTKIKRLLFLSFSFLFLIHSHFSFSQEEITTTRKGSFNIGAEGGVQFTNIKDVNSFYNPSSNTGFTAGLFGEYYVSNDFKVKLGAIYDSRGFDMDATVIFPDTALQTLSNSYYLYQVNYKVNYLTLPIGIGYERGGEKFKLLLQVYFYYSLFLNSTMNGGELYYFDPIDGFDLSGSTLNQGLNEFSYSGNTEGVSFKNTLETDTEPYDVENFNSSDLGFGLMIGGMYRITPSLGISASFGFNWSIGKLFENPELDAKWQQITRINIGILYTL